MTNHTNHEEACVEMIRVSDDYVKAFKLIRLCRWLDTEDYPDEPCPFQDDFPFPKEECPPIEDIKEDIATIVDANPFSTMEFYSLNEVGCKYLPDDRLEIMYSFTNMPQLCVMFVKKHHADFNTEKKFLMDTIKYAYMFGTKEFFKDKDSEHGDAYGEFILRKLYKISTCSYHNKNDTRELPDWVDNGKWVFNGLAYQHHILKNSQPEDDYDRKWEEEYSGVAFLMNDCGDYTEAYPHRNKYNTFHLCLFPYDCAIVNSIRNGEDSGEFVHRAKANYMSFHLNDD